MASTERGPIMGSEVEPRRGPGAETLVMGSGAKEGANWPHVHVFNDRNCNIGQRGLMGKGTIWGAQKLQI